MPTPAAATRRTCAPPARCTAARGRGLPRAEAPNSGPRLSAARRPQREPRSAAITERPGRAAAPPPLPLRWADGGLRGRPLTPPHRPPRVAAAPPCPQAPTAAGTGALGAVRGASRCGAPHGAAPWVGAGGQAAGAREGPRTCGPGTSHRCLLQYAVHFYFKRHVSGPRFLQISRFYPDAVRTGAQRSRAAPAGVCVWVCACGRSPAARLGTGTPAPAPSPAPASQPSPEPFPRARKAPQPLKNPN